MGPGAVVIVNSVEERTGKTRFNFSSAMSDDAQVGRESSQILGEIGTVPSGDQSLAPTAISV